MSLPWPQLGDRLFSPGNDIRSLALVHYDRGSILATGYRSAGDAMVTAAQEYGVTDFLVYPIVFCYRHYVELTLKRITKIVAEVDGSKRPEPRVHNLGNLWNSLLFEMGQRIDPNEREAFDAVSELIAELDSVDRKSQTFRYVEAIPFDRVDLQNLKVVMERLATFLEALADYWGAELP